MQSEVVLPKQTGMIRSFSEPVPTTKSFYSIIDSLHKEHDWKKFDEKFSHPSDDKTIETLDQIICILNEIEDKKEEKKDDEPLSLLRATSLPLEIPLIKCISITKEEKSFPNELINIDSSLFTPTVPSDDNKNEIQKEMFTECQICLEHRAYKSLCGRAECELFCKECLIDYISSTVDRSYGRCPILRCPNIHCKRFVPFSSWEGLVKKGLRSKYIKSANNLLFLKCGNCHSPGSLLQPCVDEKTAEMNLSKLHSDFEIEKIDKVKIEEFDKMLSQFNSCQITPLDFLSFLKEFFQVYESADVSDLKKEIRGLDDSISKMLKMIDSKVSLESKDDLSLAVQDLTSKIESLKVSLAEEKGQIGTKNMTTVAIRAAEIDYKVGMEKLAKLEHELFYKKSQIANFSAYVAGKNRTERVKLNSLENSLRNAKKNLDKAYVKEDPYKKLKYYFAKILTTIPDIERNSTLHLRYVSDFPQIYSVCCHKLHCFNCKTVGVHSGKTCSQQQKQYSNEIHNCPNCNVAIVKGDGCSSITCVCGHEFDFEGDETDYSDFDEEQLFD